MSTLVIPDIHNKIGVAQKIIDRHKVDKRVFLGDIYDDFGDTPEIVKRVAEWHKEQLSDPKNVFCLGNHDMPYMCPRNYFLQCSGNTEEKSKAINNVLTQEDWNKSVVAYRLDDWCLSHAGIAKRFVEVDVVKALAEVKEGLKPRIFGAGYSRGGDQAVGGVTWQDWSEFEDYGVKQIVGHTPGKKPRQKGNSWCLDTHLQDYGIIEDNGELVIYSV